MRYIGRIILSFTTFIISIVFFLLLTEKAALAIGQWTLTEPLNAPHGHSIQMVKLQNNNPFIVSGVKDCCSMTPVSEYYDVESGQWIQADDVNAGRNQYNPVLLDSGKVLIAGGWPGVAVCGDCGFNSAELYDPTTNLWTYTGSMNEARRQAVYIKLLNGKVLAISGESGNHTPLYTTEIYDPLTEQWAYTGNVLNPVAGHGNSAVVLDDGRVLLVGNTSEVNSAISQLYDPATGQWTYAGDLQVERYSASLIKLQDGRVLMIGGDQWGIGSLVDCEIYNPATGQWTYTGALNNVRNIPGVALLSDGRVLAVGGTDNGSFATSEIYNPATGQWTVDAPLNVGHYGSNPILLTNGKYLLAGGYDDSGLGTLAELYSLISNQTPVLEYIGDKTIDEGELLQFTVAAIDPDGDNLAFSASNLPAGAVFDSQTATFSWVPGFNQEGNYDNIEFTVTDDGSPIELDTELITITVGNVNRAPVFDTIGSQEVLENISLNFTVNATDPDGDNVVLSVLNLPTGASFDSQTGVFSWIPTLTQAGSYVVTFIATDDGSPSEIGTIDVVITVGDDPIPTEQADNLVSKVLGYNLPKNIENSYMANIKKLKIFIEEGKIQAAINQLNAFIVKVDQDNMNGGISQEIHDDLIGLAQALLSDLQ